MVVEFNDEHEHLLLKLEAAQKIFDSTQDKQEAKFLKKRISYYSNEIKKYDKAYPTQKKKAPKQKQGSKSIEDIWKEREKRAKTKKIVITTLIISAVVGLFIFSLAMAEKNHTYVSTGRMVIGIILLFFGIGAICMGKIIGELVILFQGIIICGGGTLLAVGSTVSRDMPNGSGGMVVFGMLLCAVGVIWFVISRMKDR